MMEKELEQAVRERIKEKENRLIESFGYWSEHNKQMIKNDINLLTRCLQFIDYCKFEFGEDITKK